MRTAMSAEGFEARFPRRFASPPRLPASPPCADPVPSRVRGPHATTRRRRRRPPSAAQTHLPDMDFSRIVVDVREGTSRFFGSSFGGGLSPKSASGGGGYTELGTGGGGGAGASASRDAIGEREEAPAGGGQGGAGGSSLVVKGLKSMGYGV